jgi:hypothetical protein
LHAKTFLGKVVGLINEIKVTKVQFQSDVEVNNSGWVQVTCKDTVKEEIWPRQQDIFEPNGLLAAQLP